MIIVTILPSTRAQKYLLQQISIKIDIIHIMSLNDFHQKRQSNGITNDTSRQDSNTYLYGNNSNYISDNDVNNFLENRAITDRNTNNTGGDLIKVHTEIAFAHLHDVNKTQKTKIKLKRNKSKSKSNKQSKKQKKNSHQQSFGDIVLNNPEIHTLDEDLAMELENNPTLAKHLAMEMGEKDRNR
eukprot:432207_1